jgi:hypothetical protein
MCAGLKLHKLSEEVPLMAIHGVGQPLAQLYLITQKMAKKQFLLPLAPLLLKAIGIFISRFGIQRGIGRGMQKLFI